MSGFFQTPCNEGEFLMAPIFVHSIKGAGQSEGCCQTMKQMALDSLKMVVEGAN